MDDVDRQLDTFDAELAALGVDTAVVELADAMRAALRLGHDLEPDSAVLGDPPLRVWACSRCASPVIWRAGSTSLYDGAARWSCADSLRGDLAQGIELEPAALAWLAEHDRTEAER